MMPPGTTDNSALTDRDSPVRPPGRRYDVFLSYNSHDRPSVERVARSLRRIGLEPWFDEWSLVRGGGWQDEIAAGLQASAACAIFIGERDVGGWERIELAAAMIRLVGDRDFRLFPVLLPGLDGFDPVSLPPLLAIRTWVDLRPGVDSERGMRDLANAVRGVPFGSDVTVDHEDATCPYRGLAAFEEADARFYFGRENHAQRLLERFRRDRFVAVVGPSGSGKSSLVRAGVLPRLKAGAVPGSEEWPVRVLRPGAHPVAALAAQLVSLHPAMSMPATVDELTADERALHLASTRVLADRPASRRVVFVVDQGEEIFTLCRDDAQRRAFLRNIHYAGVVPGGQTTVVLILRSDFYPRLAQFPAVAQLAQSHQLLLGGLVGDEIRQAIEEPARLVGLEVERGLVQTIRMDVLREPGSLPLLQYALLETWRRRQGRMLTLAGYRETGGVQRGLAERAEALYGELSPDSQAVARDVLLRLVQPGEGTEDTRRRINLREVSDDPAWDLAAEVVVRRFVAERLLTTSADDTASETWAEISHEALIRGWPRLRDWIESDRNGLRIHRRLTAAAHEWRRLGKDEGALYRGGRLLEAREWLDQDAPRLNAFERRFLDASVAADRATRTARRRRVRWTISALIAALTVITVVAVIAISSGREAARQRDIAVSRQLAANATSALEIDPSLSLALAMPAYQTAPTVQAEEILRRATADSRGLAMLREGGGPVYSARLFDDGRSAVSTAGDGTIRIWDVAAERVTATIPGHSGNVTSVRITTDGQHLASTGRDGTVALISAPDHRRQVVVRAPTGHYATTADFSPDGRLLAAALSDGSVRLVDVATGRQTASLQTGDKPVFRVSFSTDGRAIVTAGADATAQVWATATGTRTATLRGHAGPVLAAVFDPAGRTVVTTGADGTLRTWDAATGAAIAAFDVDKQALYSVAVSPDGRRIAMAGEEGLVRIWGIDGVELARMPGHVASVFDVAFSARGDRVVSAGQDGTIRIWDPGHDDATRLPATSAAYSPDGRRVAVGGSDGHVRVLSADGLTQELDLTGQVGRTWPVFSADGRRIASAGEDGSVRVWNAADGSPIAVLHPHQGVVWSAVFDPSGDRVISSAKDGTVVVSSLVGGAPEPLPRQPASVNVALFSPDGTTIVTADAAGTITLWRTREQPRLLSGHDGPVRAVAFRPDGAQLASAGVDGTVRVWRADGTAVTVLRGHQGPADSVDFGPDGTLTSSGDDGTIRVWDVAGSRELVALQVHAGPATTVDVSPDGRAALTVGQEDHVVRQTFCRVCGPIAGVLDLARSHGVRPLSPEEVQRYLS